MSTSRLAFVVLLLSQFASVIHAREPLSTWNNTATRQAIVDFVARVTDERSPDFVPESERIATFDNDGTLWSEQPMYFQGFFIVDRVKALAPNNPDWHTTEPFASLIRGDMRSVAAAGDKGLLELIAATHTGMTTEEFTRSVSEWIESARHPTTGKLYTEMVYEPMRELLAYMRANGFKTYIVSGGGVEFMRPWTQRVYGIPPEQVIGSSVKMKLEMRDGAPVLIKLPAIDLVDDKEGKPVGIQARIGRRPIAAFGNSDGDLQMLQWTMAGAGPRFAMIIHHDDAAREWAYDSNSRIGRLDTALDEAKRNGWTIVSMKADWNVIYPTKSDD
jgi:phosphoserine phosphatase